MLILWCGVLYMAIICNVLANVDLTPHAHYNETHKKTYLVFGKNVHNQDKFSRLALWESFRNKRIAFMGDSVIRYQYHALAYFLANKHFPKKEDKLCNEKLFGNWTKFFEYENRLMKGHELSESFRRQDTCCGGWTVCDNRQLHIPHLNATIWFFLWFGKPSFPHGHFNIKEGLLKTCNLGYCDETSSNHSWMLHPADFMHQFIVAHNPHLFFLNCGLHEFPFDSKYPWSVKQGKVFADVLDSLKKFPNITTKVLWKATTPHHYHLATINESVAEDLVKEGKLEMYSPNSVVLDLAAVHKSHRNYSDPASEYSFTWDGMHYQCWVYSEMNRDFAVRFLYPKL